MLKKMYASGGIGLAAPQVGINKRLMVYNIQDPNEQYFENVMVNPKIVNYSDYTDLEEEACLSFPNMSGIVERPCYIQVVYQDLQGEKQKIIFEDYEARVFQHEYDHLDGVLYIDRLNESSRQQVQPRLDELIEEFDGENIAI